MSTLQEIEAAVESLPREQQEILHSHLSARLSIKSERVLEMEPDFLARAQAIWGERPMGKPLSEIVAEARN